MTGLLCSRKEKPAEVVAKGPIEVVVREMAVPAAGEVVAAVSTELAELSHFHQTIFAGELAISLVGLTLLSAVAAAVTVNLIVLHLRYFRQKTLAEAAVTEMAELSHFRQTIPA